MPSPVVELLADFSSAVEPLGIEWYLFGAQAALLHGVVRLTNDVDITVRLPQPESPRTFVAALEAAGFQPRVPDEAFIRQTRVIPFVHASTRLELDVVLAGPGFEDRVLERADWREVEGTRIRLASAEDLIVMKVLAARPKDTEDVIAIAAANGSALDVPYVERTLTLLEEALGQSDLLPAFQTALARARRITDR